MISLFIIAIALPASLAEVENPCPDPDAYICRVRGSGSKVILSVPHGGSLRPDNIPVREDGCYDNRRRQCVWRHNCGVKDSRRCGTSLSKDLYTYELALELRARLCTIMTSCPAIILNQLHRSRMDANRDKPEATLGVPEMERAFDEYQDFLAEAKGQICGRGLLLEIHGHSHPEQRAELGYLVWSSKLRSGDFTSRDTSINSLAFHVSPKVTFQDLLRGEHSLGGLLEDRGYLAVPSPSNPAPRSNQKYFSGGYNTARHGSKYGGDIDAIQIEIARQQRDVTGRRGFVEALAQAVKEYVNMHYN